MTYKFVSPGLAHGVGQMLLHTKKYWVFTYFYCILNINVIMYFKIRLHAIFV